ncbi:MAG: replication and repair protein RecF [Chloroflexota bacterium]|nr:replication and repair protein RecF [Chloroflexota bacterium]
MQIEALSLSNFRIFTRLEMDFPDRLTLLIGNNAQGKTSVLEAVHFLSILTSPLASNDREVINLLATKDELPVGRLVGKVRKKEKLHTIEVRLILNTLQNGSQRLRKEVLIDGVKKRLFDAVGFFNSVLFLPQMTRILEDGPDERRKYLDQLLSQAYPGYVRALSEYQQALTRRNALLKLLFERNGDPSQLDYWNDILTSSGALIIEARQKSTREFEQFFRSQYQRLTAGKEAIRMDYQPSYNGERKRAGNGQLGLADLAQPKEAEQPLDYDDIKAHFSERLKELQREEIRRGVTTIGPHRDEVRFYSNDIDLAVYGSRGQIRTAVMAMKIAETQWLQEKTGELPVLLLDETLAELDEQRREDLLGSLGLDEQAILTTTDLGLFSQDFIKTCQTWQVNAGQVTRLNHQAAD